MEEKGPDSDYTHPKEKERITFGNGRTDLVTLPGSENTGSYETEIGHRIPLIQVQSVLKYLNKNDGLVFVTKFSYKGGMMVIFFTPVESCRLFTPKTHISRLNVVQHKQTPHIYGKGSKLVFSFNCTQCRERQTTVKYGRASKILIL